MLSSAWVQNGSLIKKQKLRIAILCLCLEKQRAPAPYKQIHTFNSGVLLGILFKLWTHKLESSAWSCKTLSNGLCGSRGEGWCSIFVECVALCVLCPTFTYDVAPAHTLAHKHAHAPYKPCTIMNEAQMLAFFVYFTHCKTVQHLPHHLSFSRCSVAVAHIHWCGLFPFVATRIEASRLTVPVSCLVRFYNLDCSKRVSVVFVNTRPQ